MDEQIPRWKLTASEKARLITHCPKCNSENLDPAGGPNSADGNVKCYDCGFGPFWWLLRKIGQYHLKVEHKEAYKLIKHIRFLHNSRYLKQISHEGTENGKTVVCIMIRDISYEKHGIIQKNLAISELVII